MFHLDKIIFAPRHLQHAVGLCSHVFSQVVFLLITVQTTKFSFCHHQKIISSFFVFPWMISYLVAIKLWSAINRAQRIKCYCCLSQMWDFGNTNRSLFENALLLSCLLHNPNSNFNLKLLCMVSFLKHEVKSLRLRLPEKLLTEYNSSSKEGREDAPNNCQFQIMDHFS